MSNSAHSLSLQQKVLPAIPCLKIVAMDPKSESSAGPASSNHVSNPRVQCTASTPIQPHLGSLRSLALFQEIGIPLGEASTNNQIPPAQDSLGHQSPQPLDPRHLIPPQIQGTRQGKILPAAKRPGCQHAHALPCGYCPAPGAPGTRKQAVLPQLHCLLGAARAKHLGMPLGPCPALRPVHPLHDGPLYQQLAQSLFLTAVGCSRCA